MRHNLAISVRQDRYMLASFSHNAFWICVPGSYPKWIWIQCTDIILGNISMTTPGGNASPAPFAQGTAHAKHRKAACGGDGDGLWRRLVLQIAGQPHPSCEPEFGGTTADS